MEEQLDIYREHKEENDIFYKKYWGGKNLQPIEKQKNKDYEVMENLYHIYHERDYNMKKIKKNEGIFDTSPLLLGERGIINYFDDKDRYENCEKNKDWLYMKRIDKTINNIIHLNTDKKEDHGIELDDVIKRKNTLDIYDGVPTENIYKQMILNELNNHETRENINELIEKHEDELYETSKYGYSVNNTVNSPLMPKESKSSLKYNPINKLNTLASNNVNNETIRIMDNYLPGKTRKSNLNINIDYGANGNNMNKEISKKNTIISEKDKYSNSRYDNNNNNINYNINNINTTKENTEGNMISEYMTSTNARNALINNTSPSEIKMMNTNELKESKSRKKNWLKTNTKSILQKNGDSITNFGATKNSVSTLNNDFKLMRQSGFIINSDFVKDTKYDGLNKNPYKELEILFEKANKKDISVDEIMNYFREKKYKVSYDEKV